MKGGVAVLGGLGSLVGGEGGRGAQDRIEVSFCLSFAPAKRDALIGQIRVEHQCFRTTQCQNCCRTGASGLGGPKTALGPGNKKPNSAWQIRLKTASPPPLPRA